MTPDPTQPFVDDLARLPLGLFVDVLQRVFGARASDLRLAHLRRGHVLAVRSVYHLEGHMADPTKVEAGGSIKTFSKPDPALHCCPTDSDNWVNQLGS